MQIYSRIENKIVLLLFAAVVTLNILLMPADDPTGDPVAWIQEAHSLFADHRLSVPREIASFGEPGQLFVRNTVTGEFYSKYGLMSSLSIMPPIALAGILKHDRWQEVMPISLNLWYAFVGGLLAVLLYRTVSEYVTSQAARLMYVISCLYCTCLWPYLRAQTMELFLCVYFTVWFIAIRRDHGCPGFTWRKLLVWMMVLFSAQTRPIFGLLGVITAAWLAWQIWQRTDFAKTKRILAIGMECAAPLFAVAISLMVVNHFKFGAWYYTGYHQWGGDSQLPSLKNLPNLIGFLLDPNFSILATFPPLLLALFAVRDFWLRHRFDGLLISIVLFCFLCFISMFPIWRGEWSTGPRYMLFVLPIAALPFALLLQKTIDQSREWVGQLSIATLIILLAFSGFSSYQLISRSMYAWYFVVIPTNGLMGLDGAREYLLQPQGLFLRSLDVDPALLDHHPFMVQARKKMSPQAYLKYRELVQHAVQPDNFLLLRRK